MDKQILEERQKAINWSDYEKYGCPKCGCAISHGTGCNGGGSMPSQCFECDHKFVVLADGLRRSVIGFSEGQDEHKNDIFYYPEYEKHPREGTPKHKYVGPDLRPEYGEYYSPRGLGYDLASFVKSKEAGQRVVEMYQEVFEETEDKEKLKDLFGSTENSAWLDYRPEEPKWIQVKINYGNKRKMYALTKLISEKGNIITKEIINQALDMKWTLLNIWKYEGINIIFNMFNINTIKEVIEKAENASYSYNSIESIRNISMQNKFLYYGTFIELSKLIETYNDGFENRQALDRYKDKIICCLKLLNDYINSDSFDIGENHSDTYYSVRKNYLAEGKKVIAEMLQADFE